MRNKIVTFLRGIATKLDNKTEVESSDKPLYDMMVDMYKNTLSPNCVDKEVYSVMFDAKYHAYIGTLSPSSTLSTFYTRAATGDSSYIKEPLYRMMVTKKDIETRRLSNRLRRSQ